MFHFHKAKPLVGCLLALLLGACSGNTTKPATAELQRQTVERWQNCLERNGQDGVGSNDFRKVINTVCDGHKRDVLATFPRHLEAEVEQILARNAIEYLDSRSSASAQPASDDLVRTLLR